MKKILVLGASGMLGHKVFEVLSRCENFDVMGTVTSKNSFGGTLPEKLARNIVEGIHADQIDTVEKLLRSSKPDVVINCIGVIKQNATSKDTHMSIVLNSLFPHQVAKICNEIGARFITIATDCVFDGQKGEAYHEDDLPSCHDVYGMTKYLGEIREGNALTLRTSIIGHELNSNVSLLDWFMSQENETKGFAKAIFSGFTTLELATQLAETIIPYDELVGFYHFSVNPISKHDLLSLVAQIYKKRIKIISDDQLSINRALNSDIFRKVVDYTPPTWEALIQNMYNDFLLSHFYKSKRKIYDQFNHF